jgi:hypothetical protein
LFTQGILGEDFYIFSTYQFSVSKYTYIFFIEIVFLFVLIFNKVSKSHTEVFPPVNKNICRLIIYLCIIYETIIIIRGIPLRIRGATRLELLDSISEQLIPGYGYLLLLASIFVIYLKNNRILIFFIIVGFIIDIIYHGKIFAFNSLMVVMYYLDFRGIKVSFKRLVLIGLIGISFLVFINFLRGSSLARLTVYTFFSEFIGVNATIGWAYEYQRYDMPKMLVNYDKILEDYYYNASKHGLALSPVAYFVGNFHQVYFLAISIYFAVVYAIYSITANIIGRLSLFLFMYDFIHLLRHGPNLFLTKSTAHIFVVIIIFTIFHYIKPKNAGNSLQAVYLK